MNLIPWRNKHKDSGVELAAPERSLTTLRTEMDRLFDRFFRGFEGPWDDLFSPLGRWRPTCDVSESDKEITIKAELPGVDPKDIDVTVSGSLLTISGEKRESTEDRSATSFRSERCFGKFHQSIELPTGADPDKVVADHANGVLTIRLQRSKAETPKRISVTTTKR
ncbi:MAG: Hsp20/alpha crystallin family protein [Phycisphaerae bacterium]|nr:Hsp20/alpha crystallin family protein [Phycisphaerae bacterium]